MLLRAQGSQVRVPEARKSAVAVALHESLRFFIINGWRRAEDNSTSLIVLACPRSSGSGLAKRTQTALLFFLVRLEQGPGSTASSTATNEDQSLCESGLFTGTDDCQLLRNIVTLCCRTESVLS